MKKLLLSFYFLFFIISSNVAQEKVDHKIIFQCSTSDTMAQKALMKQLGNILSVQPNTKIEIVCHGPGLNMLVDDKSVVKDKIKSFSDKGVIFNACEFSMKERKVDKSQVTSNVSFVSAGILYIVSKQEQGWSYIKAGF
jgi:intracellular sulfur oxidation DsrE/DsrF family protein